MMHGQKNIKLLWHSFLNTFSFTRETASGRSSEQQVTAFLNVYVTTFQIASAFTTSSQHIGLHIALS